MSLDAGWVTGYCCAALKPRELDDPGDAPSDDRRVRVDGTRLAKLIRQQQALSSELEYLQKQQEAQEAAGTARTTGNAKHPSQHTHLTPEDLKSSKPSLIYQEADFPSVAHKPSEAMQNGGDGILAGIARTTGNAKHPSQHTHLTPEDLKSSKSSLIYQEADLPSVAHKPSEAMQNGGDGILVSKTPRASDRHCPACLTASREGFLCPTCDAKREMLRQKDLLSQHLARLQNTSAAPLTLSSSLSYDSQAQSVRKASPARVPHTHASRLKRLENTSNVVDRKRIESWLRTSTSPTWGGDPIYSATYVPGWGNVGQEDVFIAPEITVAKPAAAKQPALAVEVRGGRTKGVLPTSVVLHLPAHSTVEFVKREVAACAQAPQTVEAGDIKLLYMGRALAGDETLSLIAGDGSSSAEITLHAVLLCEASGIFSQLSEKEKAILLNEVGEEVRSHAAYKVFFSPRDHYRGHAASGRKLRAFRAGGAEAKTGGGVSPSQGLGELAELDYDSIDNDSTSTLTNSL